MQTQLFQNSQEEVTAVLDPEILEARHDQVKQLHQDPIVISVLSGVLFEHFESLTKEQSNANSILN